MGRGRDKLWVATLAQLPKEIVRVHIVGGVSGASVQADHAYQVCLASLHIGKV